jgi:hypothetical protein
LLLAQLALVSAVAQPVIARVRPSFRQPTSGPLQPVPPPSSCDSPTGGTRRSSPSSRARAGRKPHRVAPRKRQRWPRTPRAPAPPWARAPGPSFAYIAAASPAPSLFSPTPSYTAPPPSSNPSAAAPLSISARVVSLSSWNSAGASRGGEKACSAIRGRSLALKRRRELAGVGAAMPSAPPRSPPPPSPARLR